MKTNQTPPIEVVKIFESYANKHYGNYKCRMDIGVLREFCENDKYYGSIYYHWDEIIEGVKILEEGEGWSVKQQIGYEGWFYYKIAYRKSDGKIIIKEETKITNQIK